MGDTIIEDDHKALKLRMDLLVFVLAEVTLLPSCKVTDFFTVH